MLQHVFIFFEQFPQMNASLGAGLLIFARFLGFVKFAPVISRKEVPALVKIALAFLFTIIFTSILKVEAPPEGTSLILSIILNLVCGSIIGFIAQCIFATVSAAGDIMNMQMGLSSAVMFDQSTKSQSSIIGRFFTLFGTVIFINLGGLYWLFNAFHRSFEIFQIYNTTLPLAEFLSMDYLIMITSNVLYVGLQIASPVLLATLGQDIILGIISKTAPQVNVFQLSFLFKPGLGAVVIIFILPILLNVIQDYFVYYSSMY